MAAPSGSYTAQTHGGSYPITFFVSSNRKQLQDITDTNVYMTCTGASAIYAPFTMAATVIAANGSFSRTTTQQGLYAGHPATYTYIFRGTVRGGPPRGGGTFRETLVYSDSAKHTCTSNTQSWTATRDNQPAQSTARPPVGSYTAQTQGGSYPITFYVSASRTQLQDIGDTNVYMTCTGASAIYMPLSIASATLAANGSFSQTATQQGLYAGHPATFTYTITGNFHGAGSNGAARAAGTFREIMIYTDSAKHTCNSNTSTWNATRDNQPAQAAGRLPAGSYSAQTVGGSYPITFSVSASRTQLLNVADSNVYMTCTGASAIYQQFSIAAVMVAANGSFSRTVTQQGLYAGHPATFTYTFRGNTHGAGIDGAARAAGTFSERMDYMDSAAHTCMSNTQAWAGKRTGA